VKIFTGGEAESYFKDGVVTVLITPPKGSKTYKFENVEQELRKLIPAHLGFEVRRAYRTWGDIKSTYPTWQDVKDKNETWNDVLYETMSE
jgi:hypothetical protein